MEFPGSRRSSNHRDQHYEGFVLAGPLAHCYHPPAHRLLSHQSEARIGTSLRQPRSIPGGILDSAPQLEQRAGLPTWGGPDHATRTPTVARASSWGFEVCGYRHAPPGDDLPYRIASAILLLAIFFGHCTLHFPVGRPVGCMSGSRAGYSLC